MKDKFITAHMRVAYEYARLSYCKRRKVGCVIVKDDSIIAIGYNGTPPGEENICEDCNGNSKPEIIHAEDNALRKLTRRMESAEGASMFVTNSPCLPCATRILDARIKEVYFVEMYLGSSQGIGIDFLQNRGIEVIQLAPEPFADLIPTYN